METIEIYNTFDIDQNYFQEDLSAYFKPLMIKSHPFNILLHMRRLSNTYGITESAFLATFKIFYNVESADVIKYYNYYKILRLIF
jgi:hypothetical protein